MNKLEDSLEFMNKAISRRPWEEGLWELKETILERLNRLEEAHESCARILELNPFHHEAWYTKSLIESKKGKSNDAIKSLKRAIELNDKNIERAKKDKNFNNLRKHAGERFEQVLKYPFTRPKYVV